MKDMKNSKWAFVLTYVDLTSPHSSYSSSFGWESGKCSSLLAR